MEFPDIHKAFDEAQDHLGKANILIAGKTGVGKSTLINAVFHDQLADTGHGAPVTKETSRISKDGVPITIWDTRGLEAADYEKTLGELKELLDTKGSDPDPREHIHVAWLCVLEPSSRVEEAERTLCRELAQKMPVIAVITRASASNPQFRSEVRRLLPDARHVVRVRALAEVFDGGHEIPPMGLIELIDATAEVLPEGQQAAWAAAQKVSLERKRRSAQRVVMAGAAAAAAAAAVTPIPVANAAILVPIQVTMLARISAIFRFDASRSFLGVLAGITVSEGGALAVGIVAGRLLKFVPGGVLLGGAISATTAAALTILLGEIYIRSLVALLDSAEGMPLDPDDVRREFENQTRARRKRSRFKQAERKARELPGLGT